MNIAEAFNAEYIEEQYQRWKKDPQGLSKDWHYFFMGLEMGRSRPGEESPAPVSEMASRQARVEALIARYRQLGHLLACMDPLTACPTAHPLLNLDAVGLEREDLSRQFAVPATLGRSPMALKEIVSRLRETYSRSIGVEYMHIQDPGEQKWLQEQMETAANRPDLSPNTQQRILEKLIASTRFEGYLNKRYVGVTRFSLEGGDAVIPLLDAAVEQAVALECREVILGMAHRGRLNVQTHILGRPYEEIFAEFEHCYDPDQLVGSGDVKYHNGYLADVERAGGRPVRIYLANNPSHLEAVNPVVEGIARARQDRLGDDAHRRVMPILIHGDAAFAGQGIVAETLNMSRLAGYTTGGTLHVVINNQIGYTTLPEDARSTRYSTDVAKMLMVPIFHVHGEDPEAVVHVARLAVSYRHTFGKDVVLDVVCYRRYGHNEGDEPYFTQPQMYDRIKQRPPLSQIYADELLAAGGIEPQEVDQTKTRIDKALQSAYEEIHGSACPFPQMRYFESWENYNARYDPTPVATQVAEETLRKLARRLNRVPEGFNAHPKIKQLLKKRLSAVEEGRGIDWANAEALAFASLLAEGVPVRLSGQDVARGTFSQRHSMLVDRKSGDHHIPLNSLGNQQAPFRVYNSLLSEAGVLGFEYGYAITEPSGLTLWEAQFGDFINNAQAVVDLFIASGQAKWQRLNGLTLLLPHGWEGLGPEHSSARLERFLQLCADDNLLVCNPSTPAQYFHLLRRQVRARFRKPLVTMTPKSLLRLPEAVSTLKALTEGRFETVLDDVFSLQSTQKVLLCSGKVYYQLAKRRQELGGNGTAIIRVEQFHPFPEEALGTVLANYQKCKKWIWVQEEPQNMGGWQYIQPRLEALLGTQMEYVGRPPAASPAAGFPRIYQQEQAAISDKALGPFSEQGVS